MNTYALDLLDLQILKLLQKDARLSSKQLALTLHKGNATVIRRLECLQESGHIKGVELLVDYSKLGKNLIAFTNLQLKDHSNNGLEIFQELVSAFEEVHECYHLTGNFDFMLKVVVAGMSEYQAFLKDKLAKLDNLGTVQSCLVLNEAKRRLGYPIR